MKKAKALLLAVSLVLVLLSPGLVQAQDRLAILDSSAAAEFPVRLNFTLSAQSDVNITDIRLHYAINRTSFAQVTSEVYIELVPSATVDVNWALEMVRIGGLPPESIVEYWWTVEDASGDKTETTPVQVRFDDTRYTWKNLTEGKVTIRWYKGNQSFAQEIMTTAQQALVRLAEETGAELEKPVKIYIYADARDLQGAMIFPQEWTGGVAHPRYGIIAIGISLDNLVWGKTATVHELTHLVIHQMTFNPYGNPPRWLDEGLATYNEGPLKPQSASILENAAANDTLMTVRTLSSPFSTDTAQALLAYAQSYSLVEFLISNYGQTKMRALLDTFREGSSYDDALDRIYGFDMNGLHTLWRNYITTPR